MPGWAVHTTLMLIGTQWPVSVGLAALPELPQHLWAAWTEQLGAHRDSLLLPRGAAWASGGGAAGNSSGQRVPAPTLQRKAKMYGKSRSCDLSPGWAQGSLAQNGDVAFTPIRGMQRIMAQCLMVPGRGCWKRCNKSFWTCIAANVSHSQDLHPSTWQLLVWILMVLWNPLLKMIQDQWWRVVLYGKILASSFNLLALRYVTNIIMMETAGFALSLQHFSRKMSRHHFSFLLHFVVVVVVLSFYFSSRSGDL